MGMKQLFHDTCGLVGLRVMRRSAYDHTVRDWQQHTAVTETQVAELREQVATLSRHLADAHRALADTSGEARVRDLIAEDDRKAREHTQLQPMEIPRVPGSFFIKVKIDYPDIFRPNPPDYVYTAVLDRFTQHLPDIHRTAEELSPFMYGEVMNGLPTARVNDIDPYWNNGMFERDDGRAAYAMAARFRPRRILEVGSGNSTKFFRKAISDHKIDCELVCIDPVPRADIRQVADRFIPEHVKDVNTDVFADLGEGDFLFWDGSHITFNGTDTTHFYLTILPLIRPGVFVHVHDIQLPFEYVAGYCAHYYNEQYMLATLLLNSSEWRPLLPVYWLREKGVLQHGGVSFWMTRHAANPPTASEPRE